MQEPAWVTAARALPFNSKRKITCTECHTKQTLMISHKVQGYSAYCFRSSCGFKDFHAHGMLSLAELRQRRLDTEALQTVRSVAIPSDSTSDIPGIGRLWLLRSGISSALSMSYGMTWSPRYSRLIMPVSKHDALLGYIARACDGTIPKYIAKINPGCLPIFTADTSLTLQEHTTGYDLVLCEDILSAIRVGRLAPAAAILGTSFGDELANRVMAQTGKDRPCIGVWTDGDKAGEHSRSLIRNALVLRGAEVVHIRTPKDPKMYSNREILQCLNNTQ